MTDNEKQNNYKPDVVRAVSNLINQDPEFQRQFNYLALHPAELPTNSTSLDPWEPYTLYDAYQDRPPLEYAAAGLFELPSLNVVYGAPGTLKSLILVDLAICVAAGELWLPPAAWITQPGAKGIATNQKPVMWIDFDNGTRPTHDRIGALGRARGLPIDTPIYYYSLPTPRLDAGKPESIGMMILRAKERGVKLIVIDNLGNISGGVEENSGQMIGVMDGLRQLAEETGAAVILIHHQRKGGTEKSSRAGDSLRGHSSIEASLNLALLVTREEGENTITLKSTKTRGVDVAPFGAEFTYTWKPGTTELETAKFWGVKVEDTTSSPAVEKAILEALEVEPLNQSNLIAAVKARGITGTNKIHAVIKKLEIRKKVKTTPGQKGSLIYELQN